MNGDFTYYRFQCVPPSPPRVCSANFNYKFMNQKIIIKETFQIIGIEIRTSNEKTMIDIPKWWEKFYAENVKDKIPNKINGDVLAVYTNYEGNHTKPYSYILGCEVNSLDTIPEGMVGKIILSAQYEIFTAKGKMPDKIIETWQRIWNPEIEKRRAYVTDFEVYGTKYGDPENSEVEIYIGIK
jgi:predicted transcriptional regulator YdeE